MKLYKNSFSNARHHCLPEKERKKIIFSERYLKLFKK